MFASIKENYESRLSFSVCEFGIGLTPFGEYLEELLGHQGNDCYKPNLFRYRLLKGAAEGNAEEVNAMLTLGVRVDGKLSVIDNIRGSFKSFFTKRQGLEEASYDRTPLHFGSLTGRLEVVKLLISKGANINAGDDKGIEPIHLAAGGGHKQICELLLESGANVNATGTDGVTPLHLAAEEGHLDVLKLLILRGARLITNGQKTTLHHVIRYHINPCVGTTTAKFQTITMIQEILDVIKVLLQHGADPNIKDSDSRTPLEYIIIERIRRRDRPYVDSITKIINLILEQGCHKSTILECVSSVKCVFISERFKIESLQLIVRYYLATQPGEEKPEVLSRGTDYVRYETVRDLGSYWDDCIAELEKMKKKYFGRDFSLYNFFVGKCLNKTGLYTKNKALIKYCKSDNIRKNYPVYVGMILKKLEEGHKRKKLMDTLNELEIGAKASKDITLNFECKLNIASYLSYDALFNLVRAVPLAGVADALDSQPDINNNFFKRNTIFLIMLFFLLFLASLISFIECLLG